MRFARVLAGLLQDSPAPLTLQMGAELLLAIPQASGCIEISVLLAS